jgi:hypothetical protein
MPGNGQSGPRRAADDQRKSADYFVNGRQHFSRYANLTDMTFPFTPS